MKEKEFSRRRLMQLGIGAAAGTALAATTSASLAHASNGNFAEPDSAGEEGNSSRRASIANAYLFLDQMMDAYAQGATIRLCQSYSDQIAGGTFFSTAFVYDNALLALAYLARGSASDIARAKVIGNALVYAQQHDAAADGRFRQAYMAGLPTATEFSLRAGCRSSKEARWATWRGLESRWRNSTRVRG